MYEIITQYFCFLFRIETTDEEISHRDKVKKVSDEHNKELTLPMTNEEVKKAVFAIHPKKSLDPDGLNSAFFQTYSNIVGTEVTKFRKTFFDTGELHEI